MSEPPLNQPNPPEEEILKAGVAAPSKQPSLSKKQFQDLPELELKKLHEANAMFEIVKKDDGAATFEIAKAQDGDAELELKNTTPSAISTYPLSTNMLELRGFQKYLKDGKVHLKNPFPVVNPLSPEFLLENTRLLLNNMDSDLYWQFRNYQIQNIQAYLLERLDLTEADLNDDPNIKEKGKEYQDKVAYVKAMVELFKDVTITADAQNPKMMCIKKGDDTLVNIQENHEGGLNNIEFTIPNDVVKDKAHPERLNNAIELLMDQSARLLERTHDTERKFYIPNYKHDPETVMKMYNAAIMHELKPTIDPETIKDWEEKAAKEKAARTPDDTSPPSKEKEPFSYYLEMHELLPKIANKKGGLARLKQLAAKPFNTPDAKLKKEVDKAPTPIEEVEKKAEAEMAKQHAKGLSR